jgi:putative MATE family efflux protein
MHKRTEQLGTSPVGPLLLKFSIPAITGMLVGALYNIVDRVFIGRGVGSEGIAGIMTGFPLVNVGMAFGLLVGVGTAATVSIRLGQKNTDAAERTMSTGLILLSIFSVILTILGLIFLKPLLTLFGATEETLDYAVRYMRIIMLGMPFSTIALGMNGVIRSEGNPNRAMLTMVIGAVINMILDPLFIFVFHWGMEGAAIATVLSQMVSAFWVVGYFFFGKSHLKYHRRNFRIEKEALLKILAIGVTPFAFQMAMSVLNALLARLLSDYGGTTAVSGMGIIISLVMLMTMPIIGINQGAQPVAGYNYGARRFDRVKQTLFLALIASTVYAVLGWGVLNLFPRQIIGFFNPDDPALIDFGVMGIRSFLLLLPVVGIQITGGHYFQSVGRPKTALFLTLSRQVLILIPLLVILPRFYGLPGVIYAGPISDGLSFLLTVVFLLGEPGRLKKLAEGQPEKGFVQTQPE